jgi:hypothetical protein
MVADANFSIICVPSGQGVFSASRLLARVRKAIKSHHVALPHCAWLHNDILNFSHHNGTCNPLVKEVSHITINHLLWDL